eukprot:1882587-Amphidinium_carterae.2
MDVRRPNSSNLKCALAFNALDGSNQGPICHGPHKVYVRRSAEVKRHHPTPGCNGCVKVTQRSVVQGSMQQCMADDPDLRCLLKLLGTDAQRAKVSIADRERSTPRQRMDCKRRYT